MISFEFPVTERTRTMLRLEHLYARLEYFTQQDHPYEHHAALQTLFELMETASRADLKTDLLQELERQKQALENLRANPIVESEVLENILQRIEQAAAALLAIKGKFAQHLRKNEWLMAIKQRSTIPGGVCQFDLPSYSLWQKKPTAERHQDLAEWAAPLMPTAQATAILLTLLRDRGKNQSYIARQGAFQQISGGREVQLIKVSYAHSLDILPELSANKYALSIRFINGATGTERPQQIRQDVAFNLTFCKF